MSRPERSPAPLSSGDIPSSFDDNPEFFEEGRAGKLWRKIRQEPLIPLGILATCYALYQASRSIRKGNSTQTNKMFRARIYAQGFTLVAVVAGSIFYEDERLKRRTFEKALEAKKALEKRERWIAELEARDADDRAWRAKIEQESGEAAERAERAAQTARIARSAVEDKFSSKSVREEVTRHGWGPGMWLNRTTEAWRRA
ncbi:Respiratory supercomplex factor 1, mitochondrial [Lithohypha guttulata]|uniref:Respiratory supercomplex factor 1, mitochondrial n=1 Tax=Lithohypha guttulata TaxID=1690604 RepID=A0AAN7T5L1_9EURO|nr:Respiratory supercomplex factor 1, mitochondrial [Lithohypha guttulata]KAK5090503.1 Respiratory supercomplex factor 1, mitochondrial [Lithohypha guttulata]KAK5104702.1 Respiratory supercomplex factor 1, mitochondrial [Lithohypha guttulata]